MSSVFENYRSDWFKNAPSLMAYFMSHWKSSNRIANLEEQSISLEQIGKVWLWLNPHSSFWIQFAARRDTFLTIARRFLACCTRFHLFGELLFANNCKVVQSSERKGGTEFLPFFFANQTSVKNVSCPLLSILSFQCWDVIFKIGSKNQLVIKPGPRKEKIAEVFVSK